MWTIMENRTDSGNMSCSFLHINGPRQKAGATEMSSTELMDRLVPHYTNNQPGSTFQYRRWPVSEVISFTRCPVLNWKDSMPEGVKQNCVIFPQHTSLRPSKPHPQKQRLHCTEEAQILLFLLLQGQYFCSSLEMMVGSREDFFQQKWLLSPGSSDLNCTGCFQSQQFSFHCPLLAQCCPGVTPDQSHHHLLQKKILNTGGGVKKMHLSTHSYGEDEITRQLIRMSKWS